MPGRLRCTFPCARTPGKIPAVLHLAEGGACNAAACPALTHMSHKPLTGMGADELEAASPQAQPHNRRGHQQAFGEGHHQHLSIAGHHQHAPGEARNYSQSSRKLPGAGKQMLMCFNRLKAWGWLRAGCRCISPLSLGLAAMLLDSNCMCRAGPPVQRENGAWLGPQPGCAASRPPTDSLCCCSGTFFFAATHINSTGGPEGEVHYRKEKQARFGAGRVSMLCSQAGVVC